MDKATTTALAASAATVGLCYLRGACTSAPSSATASAPRAAATSPASPTTAPQWRGVLSKPSKLRAAAGRFCPLTLASDGSKLPELSAGTGLTIVKESEDKKGSIWVCVTVFAGSPAIQASGWLPKAAVRVVGIAGVVDKYAPVAEIGISFDLLTAPRPDEWIAKARPVLLTCEHAGDALPAGYDWSRADSRLVGTHWCVDIGIREVCLEVQAALGCPAVLARYSRLFCDCNRPLPIKAATIGQPATNNAEQGGASAAYLTSPFCAIAEGQPIDLNTVGLPDDAEVEKRLAGAWRPYHNALAALVQSSPARTFVLSLHSYTRKFEEQPPREVEVGILCYPDRDLLPSKPATKLLAMLQNAGVNAEINQPYSLVLGDGSLYKTHAPELESQGRENITVELRQDKIEGDPEWRATVVRCIAECMRE